MLEFLPPPQMCILAIEGSVAHVRARRRARDMVRWLPPKSKRKEKNT